MFAIPSFFVIPSAMRNLLLLGAVMVTAACAGQKAASSSCEPVPLEYAIAGTTVYRECAVDKKASPPATFPQTRFSPSPSNLKGCYRADFEFVIDTVGRPILSTIKVLRSTDAEFTQAVRETLSGLRYTPAVKDGAPVAQLATFGRVMMAYVSSSSTPASVARASAPRSPNC